MTVLLSSSVLIDVTECYMKAGLPLSGKLFLKEDKITTITVVSVYCALDLVVVDKTLESHRVSPEVNVQLDHHEAFSAFRMKSSPLQKVKF
jgi:hypothetical protein